MTHPEQSDPREQEETCEPYAPDEDVGDWGYVNPSRKERRKRSRKQRRAKLTVAPSRLINKLVTRFVDYDKPVIDYTYPEEPEQIFF